MTGARRAIKRGDLNAFQLGGKLLRISAEEVLDFQRPNHSGAVPLVPIGRTPAFRLHLQEDSGVLRRCYARSWRGGGEKGVAMSDEARATESLAR